MSLYVEHMVCCLLLVPCSLLSVPHVSPSLPSFVSLFLRDPTEPGLEADGACSGPGAHRVCSRGCSSPGNPRVCSSPGAPRARSSPGVHAVHSKGRSSPGGHRACSSPRVHRACSSPRVHRAGSAQAQDPCPALALLYAYSSRPLSLPRSASGPPPS